MKKLCFIFSVLILSTRCAHAGPSSDNMQLAFNLSMKDYDMKGQSVIEAAENVAENTDIQDSSNVIKEEDDATELKANFYSIEQLNALRLMGTYTTEGYVTKIFECSCPPKAKCAMCMGNNIIISTESGHKEYSNLSSFDIIVFVDKVKDFQLGKKYRFLIQILDVKSTSQILNNVKLIYYEKVS